MKTLRRIMSVWVAAATVAASVSFGAAPAAAVGPVRAVDLGTLAGTCCSQALAINDNGVVVGESNVGTGENPPIRAFRWRDGVMIDLGTLGGRNATATAINNNGWIVGYSLLADGVTTHGFLWRPGIGMIDLGAFGDTVIATGVNDSGVVVGRYTTGGQLRGFRWVAGVMSDLGTPSGAGFDAYAINKYGKIAGNTGGESATWKNGVTQSSGMLGTATAINDHGDVAVDVAQGQSVSVWHADGTVYPQTMPPGMAFAASTGINESRHTVGNAWPSFGPVRAVYWSETGTPRLLPGLVPNTDSMVWGVNRIGQAVGWARPTASGSGYTAVIWTR